MAGRTSDERDVRHSDTVRKLTTPRAPKDNDFRRSNNKLSTGDSPHESIPVSPVLCTCLRRNVGWLRAQGHNGQAAGTLSGGEQQVLSIGRTLISRPTLRLLDEQNSKLALEVCDRGCVMESVTIAPADLAQQLLTDPAVRQAYLGE